MATKRHKAEKNQYNTNITKTTADIALTNVFEVTNTLPSGNKQNNPESLIYQRLSGLLIFRVY